MLNLTPHAITLRSPDGSEQTIKPSGTVARVEMTEQVVSEHSGLPVIARQPGAVTGLPDDGTPCLVSAMVLSAVPGRPNTFAPDTGGTAIRKDGQIVAVTRLVRA